LRYNLPVGRASAGTPQPPLPRCFAEAPVAAGGGSGLRPEEIGRRSAQQLDEPNRATSPVHYRDEQSRTIHDAVTGEQE
jgi:hypothetical protein